MNEEESLCSRMPPSTYLSHHKERKDADFVQAYSQSGSVETLILPDSDNRAWLEEDCSTPKNLGFNTHDCVFSSEREQRLTSRDLFRFRKGQLKLSQESYVKLVEELSAGRITTEGVGVADAIAILLRCIKREDCDAKA